jgi:hypothetical protein
VTQLRQKMLEELRRCNYSGRAAQSHVRIVAAFSECDASAGPHTRIHMSVSSAIRRSASGALGKSHHAGLSFGTVKLL